MKDGAARLNENAQAIAERIIRDAERLRVAVAQGPLGEWLIDAGARVEGSIEAGLLMAEAAMGGLGHVTAGIERATPRWPFTIGVRSSQPVLACLGSQYAGWNLSSGKYVAMGSGPARVLARVEPLFEKIAYREAASASVVVLETGEPPPAAVVEKVARATGIAAERLTFLYAPTRSLAATAQIVARVLEVALHKANDLGFELAHIVEGIAAAPLPAPHPDFLTAMGRTNDAIIYGGLVQLFVRGPEAAARELAERLPSAGSRDHGRPFKDIFHEAKGDFYAIDPLLFSPAEAIVTALETGRTFRGGGRDLDMLERSLG